jgi:hypothetical protein
VEVITRAGGSCDVLLALIGDEWLTITDEHGRRRLDDPDDFMRLEIEAALTRNVRVIPILVDGVRMPRVAELPASLEVADESPLPAGTVGVFPATDTKKAVEMEFDNFIVKQV